MEILSVSEPLENVSLDVELEIVRFVWSRDPSDSALTSKGNRF
jgi:hypothetical protein